jgi:hypothetical protein
MSLQSTEPLSPAEEAIMKHTFKVTMLRAADIIDRITNDDVMDAQTTLFSEGMSLGKLAKIDRAMLAANYLRACAQGLVEEKGWRWPELKQSLSTEKNTSAASTTHRG